MSLKLIFMGTPDFAVPILNTILETGHKILTVYTQNPKKSNRGQKINISPIHKFSNEKKLNVRTPFKLDYKERDYIQDLKPDLVVVVAYGKIIPTEILDIEGIKFINVHASLLPKWRGAAPIQRAILNLDKETGISIMKILPKLDSGPIMMQSKINISPEENSENLSKKLSDLGAKLIINSLGLIKAGKAEFVKQNEEEATYAKKLNKSESKINWNEKANKVIAKINAFNPNPGSWFNYEGARIKILKAKEIFTCKDTPGKIINKNFTVSCQENAIQILEIQKEGKKKLNISDYLKGNSLKIGSYVD